MHILIPSQKIRASYLCTFFSTSVKCPREVPSLTTSILGFLFNLIHGTLIHHASQEQDVTTHGRFASVWKSIIMSAYKLKHALFLTHTNVTHEHNVEMFLAIHVLHDLVIHVLQIIADSIGLFSSLFHSLFGFLLVGLGCSLRLRSSRLGSWLSSRFGFFLDRFSLLFSSSRSSRSGSSFYNKSIQFLAFEKWRLKEWAVVVAYQAGKEQCWKWAS